MRSCREQREYPELLAFAPRKAERGPLFSDPRSHATRPWPIACPMLFPFRPHCLPAAYPAAWGFVARLACTRASRSLDLLPGVVALARFLRRPAFTPSYPLLTSGGVKNYGETNVAAAPSLAMKSQPRIMHIFCTQ